MLFTFVKTAEALEHRRMEIPEEDVNHRAVKSRSAHKVNDCNKEITSQTLLAAPVTECLLYLISLFTQSFKQYSRTGS